jgi:hypothetical protein
MDVPILARTPIGSKTSKIFMVLIFVYDGYDTAPRIDVAFSWKYQIELFFLTSETFPESRVSNSQR